MTNVHVDLLDSLLLAEEDVVLVSGQRLPQSDVGGIHSVHPPSLTCIGGLHTQNRISNITFILNT